MAVVVHSSLVGSPEVIVDPLLSTSSNRFWVSHQWCVHEHVSLEHQCSWWSLHGVVHNTPECMDARSHCIVHAFFCLFIVQWRLLFHKCPQDICNSLVHSFAFFRMLHLLVNSMQLRVCFWCLLGSTRLWIHVLWTLLHCHGCIWLVLGIKLTSSWRIDWQHSC